MPSIRIIPTMVVVIIALALSSRNTTGAEISASKNNPAAISIIDPITEGNFAKVAAPLVFLSAGTNVESLDFYFDYVEKQGVTLGHYYAQILPNHVKQEYPDYAERFKAWQERIPPAVNLLEEFHGALVRADRYCYKKPDTERCKTAMSQVKVTGDRYTDTSRALADELERVIEFGKSKGLR